MASSSSTRQSSNKSKNSVFVPSPRFLSESPAKKGSPGHVDYPGQPPFASHSQAPHFSRNLKSPIPPPPANLYHGSPAAFNVDPGAPFLAAAGPTDDGHLDRGSVRDDPGPKGLTGAFVTGIKNVVRRSLRDRTRSQDQQNHQQNQQESQDAYNLPPQFRDSGYAASSLPIPPSGLPPMPEDLSTHASSARNTVYSAHAPSETLLGHAEERYDRDEATVIGHSNSIGKQKAKPVKEEYDYDTRYDQQSTHTPAQQYQRQVTESFHEPSPGTSFVPASRRHEPPQPTYSEIIGPEDIASPVSAKLQYGPNYMQMNLVTPPPSETSLNTYLKRLQKFTSDVNSLPWVGKERVTKDYYPERSRRSDEPKKAPAIVWRSEAFMKVDGYHAEEGEDASDASFSEFSVGGPDSLVDGSVKMGPGTHAPRRGSYGAMDLDAEFEGSRTPMPANPPNMTPYVRPRGVQLTDTPMPRLSQPPDSVLFQGGPPPEIPPPPPPPPPAPPADNRNAGLVHAVPSYPPPTDRPPMAQTPRFYVPPSAPPSAGGGAASTQGQSPRHQHISSNGHPPPPPPPPPPPGFADPNPNNWPTAPATPNWYTGSALDQIVPTAEFPYLGPNPDWGGGGKWQAATPRAAPVFPAPETPRGQEQWQAATPRAGVFPATGTPRGQEQWQAATPRAAPVFPATPRGQEQWQTATPRAAPVFPATPRGQGHYTSHSESPSPVIPTPRIPASTPAPAPATPRAPPPQTPRSEWEQYPSNHMTGYVPSQFAEHYYGEQYGPGVHAARPPMVPPPVTASVVSGRSSRRSSVAPSATSRRSRG